MNDLDKSRGEAIVATQLRIVSAIEVGLAPHTNDPNSYALAAAALVQVIGALDQHVFPGFRHVMIEMLKSRQS